MSIIFITNIVGTGTYAVPDQIGALNAATAGFHTLLGGVAGLSEAQVLAYVKDSSPSGGGEGTRTLCCLVETYTYGGSYCPSEAQTDALFAAIRSALEADPNITTIGAQYVENVSSV
jgi:hypothetical protein